MFRRAVSLRLGNALAVPGAAVHLYRKAESHPRRKLGHVTVTAGAAEDARQSGERAVRL